MRTPNEMQDPPGEAMEFRLSPRRIAWYFAMATVVLTAISWITHFARFRLGYGDLLGIRPIFDVGSDLSIPTWYSSFALLVASVLLAVIAVERKRARAPQVGHWTGLAIIFLLMSIDETAAAHERAGSVVSLFVETTGLLYYGWLVLGIGFVLVFGLAYLRFVIALPRGTRELFVLAGIIFVGGAVGVEAYNARYDELYGADNMHYMTMTTVEEFLEKTGIVLFIYALLRHIEHHSPSLWVIIGGRRVEAAPARIGEQGYVTGESTRPRVGK